MQRVRRKVLREEVADSLYSFWSAVNMPLLLRYASGSGTVMPLLCRPLLLRP